MNPLAAFPNHEVAELQMHNNIGLVQLPVWVWDRKLNFPGHFSGNAWVAHPGCNVPIPGRASSCTWTWAGGKYPGMGRTLQNPTSGRQLGQAGTYKSRITPSFPSLLRFSSCLHPPPLPKPPRHTPRILLQLHSCSLPKSFSFPPLLHIFPLNHSFLSPSPSISFLPWNLNLLLSCCKGTHKSKKSPVSPSLDPNPAKVLQI